jgi:hypothetical protein
MVNALASELLNWDHSKRNATARPDPASQQEIFGLRREDFVLRVYKKKPDICSVVALSMVSGLAWPENR